MKSTKEYEREVERKSRDENTSTKVRLVCMGSHIQCRPRAWDMALELYIVDTIIVILKF